MTKDARREVTVSIRMSSQEHDRLKLMAQQDGRSVGNFVRRYLLEGTEMDPPLAVSPTHRPPSEKTALRESTPSTKAPDEIIELGENATPTDVERARGSWKLRNPEQARKDEILKAMNRKPR